MKNLLLLVLFLSILSFTKVSAFSDASKVDKQFLMHTSSKNCYTGSSSCKSCKYCSTGGGCGVYTSESDAILSNTFKSKPATIPKTINDTQRQGTNNKKVNVQKNNGSGFYHQHT